MPNWCIGDVWVKGKPKNVEKFVKLFLFDNARNKKRYFARSFIFQNLKDFKEEYKDELKSGEINFCVDFAWSVWSCLIEGYPQSSKGKCPTLKKICKELKVDVEINSEECGLGFEELVRCSSKGELDYQEKPMKTYRCKCGSEQFIESSRNLEDTECYECEKIPKWKEVKEKDE